MPQPGSRSSTSAASRTGVLELRRPDAADSWQLAAVDEAARRLAGLGPAPTADLLAGLLEFIGQPASFTDWLSGTAAEVGTTQFARIVSAHGPRRDAHVALTLATLDDHRATIWIRLMSAAEVVQIAALASPVAVVLVDQGLIVRWANPAAMHTFGLPAARIVGSSLYEFSTTAQTRRDIHARLFRGEIEEFAIPEAQVQVDDGPIRYAMGHLQVLRDHDGSVDCLAVYTEDVTERVRLEAELKARNTRYRALTRHERDLITICDAQGNTLIPSGANESLLGYTQEERIGKSIFELIHPEDRPRAHERLAELIRNPGSPKWPLLEVRLMHRNGSWVDVEYAGTNLLDDPQVAGIVLVGRIITRRKQFERRLQSAKDALELAIDGVHVSFWDYDVATGIVSAAAVLTPDTGDGASESVQRSAVPHWSVERLHPADRPQFEHAVHAIIAGSGKLVDIEVRVREEGGSWTWLLLRARLASGSRTTEPHRLTGMSVDVTNLKSAQATAASDRLKLQFALSAAHIGTWEYTVADRAVQLDARASQLSHSGHGEQQLHVAEWIARCHPDDRPGLEAWVATFTGPTASVQDCEYRHIGEDGVARRLLMRGYFAESPAAGENARIAGIVLEIDALRAAELRLRETEDKFATALWAAQVGYWTVDLVNSRAEMSPEYFELTGIDPAEWHAERHPWDARIHPDDWPKHVRWKQRCVKGQELHYESEYRLRTPTGWIWVSDRGRIVERDTEGRATVLAGTTVNVSARKELEHQLVSAATLEQRRLSQDLHDGLGQELAGIAYLLSGLATRIKREYGTVVGEVEHLSVLMRQAVASARAIAHGLLPAGLVSGGLSQAIRELCAGAAATYGVRVDCELGQWETGAVPDDAAQHIYRIVQEALNNARRHGRASVTRVTIRVESDTLCVSVADNGRGLPAELPPDAGFGLRIMHSRAHTMGAELQIGARPDGTGTLVFLRCPLVIAGDGRPVPTGTAGSHPDPRLS